MRKSSMLMHFGKFGDRRAVSCLLGLLCVPLAVLAQDPTDVGRVRITDSDSAKKTSAEIQPTGFLRSLGGNADASADCPYCRRQGGGGVVMEGPIATDGMIAGSAGPGVDCYGRCRGCGFVGCRCPITNIRPPTLAPVGRTEIMYQKYWSNAWM